MELKDNLVNRGKMLERLTEFLYLGLIGVSIYAIYAIYEDFVNVDSISGVDTSALKSELGDASILVSCFYILILLTALYIFGIMVSSNYYGNYKHRMIVFVLNCFLTFFGFITIIPSGIAYTEGADVNSIGGPLASSAVAVFLGFAMILNFTYKGPGFYLKE